MQDIDKVIAALECLSQGTFCSCCSYGNYHECKPKVANDALELLRFFRDSVIKSNEEYLKKIETQEENINGLIEIIKAKNDNEDKFVDELTKTFLK